MTSQIGQSHLMQIIVCSTNPLEPTSSWSSTSIRQSVYNQNYITPFCFLYLYNSPMNMYKQIDSYDVEEGHELIVRDKETGKERHGIVQHVSDHRFVLKCRKDTVWCNKADCTTTLTFIKLDNKLSKAKLLWICISQSTKGKLSLAIKSGLHSMIKPHMILPSVRQPMIESPELWLVTQILVANHTVAKDSISFSSAQIWTTTSRNSQHYERRHPQQSLRTW